MKVMSLFRNLNEQFHYQEKNGFERREGEEEEEEDQEEHKSKIRLRVRLC